MLNGKVGHFRNVSGVRTINGKPALFFRVEKRATESRIAEQKPEEEAKKQDITNLIVAKFSGCVIL